MVWLNLLWTNKKLVGDCILILIVILLLWWFFIHNPKVIDGLEEDKAELSRQVTQYKELQAFQDKINKNNKRIDNATFTNISTIKASTIPKRTVIIRGGVPLPTVR